MTNSRPVAVCSAATGETKHRTLPWYRQAKETKCGGTGNETRPIGIPTLEDKVLQRAVAMILGAIYEQDFYDGSYGFRPGRSARQALDSLWRKTMGQGGGWILDMDIRKFFDTLDHGHLREFLRHRVRDGVLSRLIGKWLKAGVMEDGSISYPESGSPQGGVISPILANAFLHYVLDRWFAEEVVPRLKGRTFLIRYADDAVMGFTREEDARRVLAVLPKRFGKYGLTIHPEKTKLIDFRQPPHEGRPRGGPEGDRPGTFDFLGFTHFWARSRKGNWVVKRKTMKSRFTRALRKIAHWCRDNRLRPIAEQHAVLSQKLRGHYAYYGITGNSKNRPPWNWFHRLRQRYCLPYGIAVHSVCRRRSKLTT